MKALLKVLALKVIFSQFLLNYKSNISCFTDIKNV